MGSWLDDAERIANRRLSVPNISPLRAYALIRQLSWLNSITWIDRELSDEERASLAAFREATEGGS